ncbi:MAG TPA: hypothetical protein VF006_29255 [Longimicrobium sp.]
MRLGARSTFGMLFLGFAAILLLGEILVLAYPVGTQMANDANVRTPLSRGEHAMWLGIIAALSAAGWWLMFGGRPRRNTPTHPRHHG